MLSKVELDSLANSIVKMLMPKIEKAIDKKIANFANINEDLITQDQLANLLGVHPSTLHGKADIYPHVMIGSRKRFLKSRVLEMLTNQ